jgi:hypothetical protein
MAISKIGGTGSDNWELISSVTPTAAAAAVNFTGLSPYKKLMVVADGVTLSVTEELDIRINNDSANKYLYSFWSGAEQVTQAGFTSKLSFTNSTTTISAMVVIENCDNAGVKFINKGFGGATGTTTQFLESGIYLASAIVTQINVIVDNTFAGAGTMSLYGVK